MITRSEAPSPARPGPHPLWTRAFHGFNLLVLLLMAASGLEIYNAHPVFGGRAGATVPAWLTLGGWLAGGRDLHFGVMGLYAANLGLWIGLLLQWRHRRLADGGDLGSLRRSASPPRRRLASHRITYTLMLIVLSLSLLTGLAMYKPAQLWWLVSLFAFAEPAGLSSWQMLRVCHLVTIPAIAMLLVAHVRLSWRVGGLRLLRRMAL